MSFLHENSVRVASQLASVVSLPNNIKIKEQPDQSSCSELTFVSVSWHHGKSCLILRRNQILRSNWTNNPQQRSGILPATYEVREKLMFLLVFVILFTGESKRREHFGSTSTHPRTPLSGSGRWGTSPTPPQVRWFVDLPHRYPSPRPGGYGVPPQSKSKNGDQGQHCLIMFVAGCLGFDLLIRRIYTYVDTKNNKINTNFLWKI